MYHSLATAKLTTWVDFKGLKQNLKNHQMEEDSTDTDPISMNFCHKKTSEINEKRNSQQMVLE